MRVYLTVLLTIISFSGFSQSLIPGTIAADQCVCLGFYPAILTSTPPNGTAPVYQWQSSLNNSTFANINGATMTTYQPGSVTGKTFYRQQQNATGVTGGPLPTNTITVGHLQLVRLLQNDTISGYECYNAADTLTVAVDAAHAWETTSTAHVTMISGQVIQFLPGAHFDSASYLSAYIRTSIRAVDKVTIVNLRKVNGVSKALIMRANGVNNY